ncbi:MAG: hypothetical protein IT267_10205 [Saprospiraceae bacterium]|nr:hypothetical protein [Saprospiraceae bacterium]
MANSKINEFLSYLNKDFNVQEALLINNSHSLRRTIGVLGIGLPFLLFIFFYISSGISNPLESISHYYFTRVSGIFVVVMSVLSLFLIIYKGYNPLDFILSLLAGISGFCVVFFPTDNISNNCGDLEKFYNLTIFPQDEFRTKIHFISATVFLLSLACMSLFLFTKSKNDLTKNKKRRNLIYKLCGLVMIVAMLFILLAGFFEFIPKDTYVKNSMTFWMESVAVVCFGISWLTKSEVYLKDSNSF